MMAEVVPCCDTCQHADGSGPLPRGTLAFFCRRLNPHVVQALVRVDALLAELRVAVEVEQALEDFLVEGRREERAIVVALCLRQVAAPGRQTRRVNRRGR